MKYLLSLIIGGALVVSGFGQTRNVLVGTNNAVVQPTNFWSADAVNARSGLGLGTAATNPASAFQPSSSVLSNLASSNAVNLTNLRATNVVGTLSLTQGGTGSTNAADARTAFGLGTAATNPASAFQPSSAVLSNLAAGSGIAITNIAASNIVGAVAVVNGGTGATNGATARTNLGISWSALTNTNSTSFFSAINSEFTNNLLFLERLSVADISEQGIAGIFIDGGGTRTIKIYSPLGNETLLTETGILYNSNSIFSFDTVEIYVGKPFLWTNASDRAATRTNLGLGWSALTNSNAGTRLVSVNTNGEVVSPTNFWQVAPISTTVQYQTNVTGTSTNAATNSRNLFLFSLSPSVSGITNTVTLPTNTATTFEGDRATIIHLAQTANAVTAIRQLGAATNLITLNQLDEAVLLMYRSGAWMLADNISYVEPIFFSGTNAAANAAASRTNLGVTTVGNAVFTATNAGAAATAIELGATNNVTFRNLTLDGGTNPVADEVSLGMLSSGGEWSLFSLAASDAPPLNQVGGYIRQGSLWLRDDGRLYQKIGGTGSGDNEWGKLLYLDSGGGATNARSGLGLSVTNNVTFSNITASGTLTATSTVTAKTNLIVEGHLDFTTNATNSNPATNNQIQDFIEIRVGTNQFWLPLYK